MDLFTVMRSKDCKCRHHIDQQRQGNVHHQGLHKEQDMMLSLTSSREKFTLKALIMLRDEERQCTKAVVANPGVDLMIKEFLDVVDGERVFTIH